MPAYKLANAQTTKTTEFTFGDLGCDDPLVMIECCVNSQQRFYISYGFGTRAILKNRRPVEEILFVKVIGLLSAVFVATGSQFNRLEED